MGSFFSMLKRKQNKEERAFSSINNSSFSITSFFGSEGLVSEEQALKVPAVAASLDLITSSIARLPIYLYQENEKNEITRLSDRRIKLLNNEPNELTNGYNFKKQIVKDYLLHGTSYTKIERARNDVISLYNLPIKDVSVTKYLKDGYKYSAKVNLNYGESYVNRRKEFYPEELLIVLKDSYDGISSSGILKNNSDIIQLALDEIEYSTGILKNGALPIGILKSTSRLTEPVIERLRNSWSTLYSGSKNSGKTIILEEGLEYKPISLNPNEMDLTNSKKSTLSEIARIFNVPESMINSNANKYASNEQNNIQFLQYCIAPIITAIEASLNKSLLLETEKMNGYYFRFDTSEILRTTEKEKVETAAAGMKGGLLSINEARAKLDLKALDEDYFLWGLGDIFFNSKTGEITIPNLGKTIDPKKANELTEEELQALDK